MLTSFTGGKRRFSVDAETVAGAFAAAAKIYPMLRAHIFDEAGGVREHVQIFVNATDSRQLPSLNEPVSDGDEIIILQAISGGLNTVVAGSAGVPPAVTLSLTTPRRRQKRLF
jgi:molybdopterin converting factor small subunit